MLSITSIFILLTFAVIVPLAAYAQDSLRVARPIDTVQQSHTSAPALAPAINEDASSFHVNIPPSHLNNTSTLNGAVSQGNSLTQVQLQRLAAHDIVLLIDKSGSMATPDCPLTENMELKAYLPNLVLGSHPFADTRWQWCRQQIEQMSALTRGALPGGFSVLLFDSSYYLFPHVTEESLPRIFENNGPGGSTNLTLPLSTVFNDYFKREKISRVKIKPLLVGVITDGCPDEPHAVRKLLVDLTHSLQDSKEITIIFFLIGGHDSQGEKFVQDLTEKLISHGATFNIVKGIPFSEVQRSGLARTLADNLD